MDLNGKVIRENNSMNTLILLKRKSFTAYAVLKTFGPNYRFGNKCLERWRS